MIIATTAILIGTSLSASAALYQSFTGGSIAQQGDAQTFTGNFTQGLSGDVVHGITVNLNISGSLASGFIISLTGPGNGTTITLLDTSANATPFGSSFNITLADGGTAITGSTDFRSGGTYAPAESLSSLNGLSANGQWTLFFQNLNSGGGDATLNGWSLTIDAVPEPVNMALAVFGGGLGTFLLFRNSRKLTALVRQNRH